MFVGVELVADRAHMTPPSASLGLPAKIRNAAMAQGLLCYPGGGTADGRDGAHVLLAPPFIYEDRHVDELIEKLGRALDQVDYV